MYCRPVEPKPTERTYDDTVVPRHLYSAPHVYHEIQEHTVDGYIELGSKSGYEHLAVPINTYERIDESPSRPPVLPKRRPPPPPPRPPVQPKPKPRPKIPDDYRTDYLHCS